MSAPRQSLTDLLSPIDCDVFFRDYWERQPLHVPHDNSARYRRLFTNVFPKFFIWRCVSVTSPTVNTLEAVGI